MSAALLKPVSGFKLIARLSLFLAIFLMAFTIFDYAKSGPLRVTNATFEDNRRDKHLTIILPFEVHSNEKSDYYVFTFKPPASLWDGLYPLRLVPQGCISDISVNDSKLSLVPFSTYQLCDGKYGISLETLHAPAGRLRIVLQDTTASADLGLKLMRFSLLTPFQRILMFMAAAYLLSLSAVRDERSLRSFHYAWLVTGIFVFSFLFECEDWLFWAGFLGNGLAIAFVAMLGALWLPVRPVYERIDRTLDRIVAIPPKAFACIAMGAFFILTGSLSQILFDGLPHITDTHVQYMESHIMATGHLYVPSHPLKDFFNFQDAINDGKYYGGTFPGHPFLLAIGQLLHIPWLVNPFLGALTVGVVFLLAYELGGRGAATIAAPLMLVSPLVVFMSSEYMNHVSCMLFLTLFLYAYIKLCKTGERRFAIIAGCSIGFALLIRVQSAVPFGLPMALHAVWTFARAPKKHFRNTLLLAGSFALFAAPLLYYDYSLTGSPWVTGYDKYDPGYGEKYKEFLNPDRWSKFPDDLASAVQQLQELHKGLFGWPTTSLLGVFLLYFFRLNPPYANFVLACFGGQVLALIFLQQDNGSVMFPRYLYESNASLIVLTALAIQNIPAMARKLVPSPVSIRLAKPVSAVALAALSLAAIPYSIADSYRTYANNFWEGDFGYYYMLTHSVEKPALVFMARCYEYRLVYFTLPPSDDSPVIFALDRGEENKKLIDFYPGRHAYTVDGWDLRPYNARSEPWSKLPYYHGPNPNCLPH